MARIASNLSVSDAETAKRIGCRFDCVVSLADPNEHTTYENLISDGPHEYEEFESAVDNVIDALEDEKSVLVHCRAGISRSVSVCIASYAVYNNVSYNEAYNNCRTAAQHPNPDLLDSAQKYIEQHS